MLHKREASADAVTRAADALQVKPLALASDGGFVRKDSEHRAARQSFRARQQFRASVRVCFQCHERRDVAQVIIARYREQDCTRTMRIDLCAACAAFARHARQNYIARARARGLQTTRSTAKEVAW